MRKLKDITVLAVGAGAAADAVFGAPRWGPSTHWRVRMLIPS
jgi:hypothetical protein